MEASLRWCPQRTYACTESGTRYAQAVLLGVTSIRFELFGLLDGYACTLGLHPSANQLFGARGGLKCGQEWMVHLDATALVSRFKPMLRVFTSSPTPGLLAALSLHGYVGSYHSCV